MASVACLGLTACQTTTGDSSLTNVSIVSKQGWDVSSGTTFASMFQNANSFNQDISSWNVSKVASMQYMFYGARAFNQDISTWDVSKVTRMYRMFHYATSFNQDISSWDTYGVHDFTGMFFDCPINARELPWFDDNMLDRYPA